MCGFAGFVRQFADDRDLRQTVAAMTNRLRHRGPDDEGMYLSDDRNTSLGHTRLSILDLSAAGHQPMLLAESNYVIVFNGEIYNFRELRSELERQGDSFHSRSDTEVILRLYQRYGPACVAKLNGMFAFAIWDVQQRRCFLARDALGIKPLYIWQTDGHLAFASEIRSLLEANLDSRRINPNALRNYLLFGSVQEPDTLVEGVTMLPAGHWMTWQEGESNCAAFWQLPMDQAVTYQDGLNRSADLPVQDRSHAIQTTRTALIESVRKHHVSDVPVNLFLSGGIDSTALLCLSDTCGFRNLRTFSISFDEAEFNEGELARRTAAQFGTEHYDWRMTDMDGQGLIDSFLTAMDQPSNDGFNTYCVSKFAHDHTAKVVLSGLGGDELFGGYPSFQQVPRLQKYFRVASLAGDYPRRMLGAAFLKSRSGRHQRFGAFLSSTGNLSAAYWTMRGFFPPSDVSALLEHYTGTQPPANRCDDFDEAVPQALHPADAVYLLETTRYMRNQLLRDSDVMSMAWGLELRVPFVDQQLVNSLSSIPATFRLARGKQLLLDAVPEIPTWIRTQPKRGFRFPFDRWISKSWGELFTRLDQACPVRLTTWYHRWCLFTLEHFLRENRIQTMPFC